jgi:general secretion pathway protein A
VTAAHLASLGLREPPVSKEIPDGGLWVPTSNEAIVDTLLDALPERSPVLLTGDPGVGKTCVLRALRHRIPSAGHRLTYCHHATLGRRDF